MLDSHIILILLSYLFVIIYLLNVYCYTCQMNHICLANICVINAHIYAKRPSVIIHIDKDELQCFYFFTRQTSYLRLDARNYWFVRRCSKHCHDNSHEGYWDVLTECCQSELCNRAATSGDISAYTLATVLTVSYILTGGFLNSFRS